MTHEDIGPLTTPNYLPRGRAVTYHARQGNRENSTAMNCYNEVQKIVTSMESIKWPTNRLWCW